MIDHLIQLVAAAHVAEAEANAAHANDAAEVDRLAARVEQCQARKSAITARRLAGQSTPEEAAEFAALGGDLDVLADLLGQARASANASRPDAARAALARAEAELQQAREQAAFDAVVERAREIERVYIAALDKVWLASRARGSTKTFGQIYDIAPAIRDVCRLNYWAGGQS